MMGKIIKTEGPSGLFKGVASPLFGQAPISASAFMANDFMKRILDRSDVSENKKILLSGVFTGLVTTVFTTPIEYMKIKKQAHMGENLTYTKILRSEGILGVFKGYTATCLRDVPGWCAYFFAYEYLKSTFQNIFSSFENEKRALFLAQFMAGGFAGQVSWLVSYPTDVVKSYIQYHPENASVVETATKLYSRHGFRYFFKGLSPCLLRAYPINSIVFVAYEYFLELFNSTSTSD